MTSVWLLELGDLTIHLYISTRTRIRSHAMRCILELLHSQVDIDITSTSLLETLFVAHLRRLQT
jgi:hypothetical protein